MSIEAPNPFKDSSDPAIEQAASFEDLYTALRARGKIDGTQKAYDADELILKIDQVRSGQRDLSFITRSYGIRATVERLLEEESV